MSTIWPRGTRLGFAEYCGNCGWRPSAHGVFVEGACGPDHPWSQHAVPGTMGTLRPCSDYRRRSTHEYVLGLFGTILGAP